MNSRFIRRSLVAIALAALAACETADRTPPQVASLPASARRTSNLETLGRGREIFLTRCTECHGPQPIQKYSVERWHKIVGWMAPYAKLSDSDRAALIAYLDAARRSYPQ